MSINSTIFEQKNHPTIKVFDDKISIKAIDYPTFRDFTFDKIKELKFHRPFDNSIIGFLYLMNPFFRRHREEDNYVLRVTLKDGDYWDYETTSNFDQSFVDFLKVIQARLMIKNS